jgi:hypothetical protein
MEKNTSRCLTQKAPYKGLAAMSAKGQKRSNQSLNIATMSLFHTTRVQWIMATTIIEDVPRERL